MFNTKGVAWVGLFAFDLETLAGFYANTLGLRIIEQSHDCCILDAGSGALLEIWGKGCASAGRKTPEQQSMLVGFLVERLEPAVEALKVQGLFPETEIGSYRGSRWVHYKDPEGNRFELKDLNGY